MPRREFSKKVRLEIVKRAMLPSGEVACEGCGLILGGKPYEIDHTIPEAMVTDRSRKLTAEDGKLLGKGCCHAEKTRKRDVPAIAEAKRREAKNLRVTTRKQAIRSAPFPKSEKAAKRPEKKPLPPRPLYQEAP